MSLDSPAGPETIKREALETLVPLPTIQVLLGHADIRTTARYLNVSLQRLQAVRSPFDALQLQPIDHSQDHSRQR